MRPIVGMVLIAGCVAASAVAYAQSGESLAKSKGCNACHASDAKVGPTFKEIATKYRGDKSAEARLIGKIKDGNGHPKVLASDDELKAVVQYVLSQ